MNMKVIGLYEVTITYNFFSCFVWICAENSAHLEHSATKHENSLLNFFQTKETPTQHKHSPTQNETAENLWNIGFFNTNASRGARHYLEPAGG
jgi:hypothetical protein